MRFKWESIDAFRPPNRKHIPRSEYAALGRAIAQKNNNALQMLKCRPAPITVSQEKAASHEVTRESKLKFLRILSLKKPVSERPSELESLPHLLIEGIFSWLPYSDYMCLALSSTTLMHHGAAYHCTIRALFVLSTGFWFPDDKEDWSIWDHVELMERLEHWMPAGLKFCHHCLKYVNRLNFGFADIEEDALTCMNCRRHIQHSNWELLPKYKDCNGCVVQKDALDKILETGEDGWVGEGTMLMRLHQNKGPVCFGGDTQEIPWLPRIAAMIRDRPRDDYSDG